MIIPISHESDTVRRLPWVTFAIMASCLIIHIFISLSVKSSNRELENAAREYLEYYFQHPYLEFDMEFIKMLFGESYVDQVEQTLEVYRKQAPQTGAILKEIQQERLDELAGELKRAINNLPYRKWGFIPANKTFIGLLAYMFIHGGWLHLIGNLLFLYLTGPFIEDVWGRPLFGVFYIVMGMLAGLMFAAHYPRFPGPLIGASGAVFGVWGAFLIRYWNTRIKFAYILLPFAIGTFTAPAWLMLPLGFFWELLSARAMDSLFPEGGGGVAHWAHIWGFLFGVGVAFTMKYFKVEEKHIHPKIEAQVRYVPDGFKAVSEAVQKKHEGKFEDAFNILMEAAENGPLRQDVVESLWELSVEMGRENDAAKYLAMLTEKEVRNDQLDVALGHFRLLRGKVPDAAINLTYKITLLQYLTDENIIREARELATEVLQEVDVNLSPTVLLRLGDAALKIDPFTAQKALEVCLKSPGIPEEEKARLRKDYDQFQSKVEATEKIRTMGHESPQAGALGEEKPETAEQAEEQPAAEEAEAPEAAAADEPVDIHVKRRSIKATICVPLGFKEGRMAIEMEEIGKKWFPLKKARFIAVAKISFPHRTPFHLIDLLLDDPKSDAPSIRAIRMFSSRFAPEKFFPKIQDPLEALKAFTTVLLKLSGAMPFPDKETVMLSTPMEFNSLEEYEQSMLSS